MTRTDAWGYKLVQLKSGREWEVIEDYTYHLRSNTRITVCKGFVYDGASIPRVFWRFIGPPAAGKYAHAALLHDWLYVRQVWFKNGKFTRITRKEADDIMLMVMKEDGVSWWRRNAIHRAVRLGGGRAWRA